MLVCDMHSHMCEFYVCEFYAGCHVHVNVFYFVFVTVCGA